MEQAKIYMLYSSSKGNTAYVKYGRDEFLIDCGVSAKMIETALNQIGTGLKNISAVFITHEHSDHIKGLATITKYFGMPIYAPANCCEYLIQNAPYCGYVNPLTTGDVVELKDTAICPIVTPHDARGSVGFRIRAGEEKLGYFTDIGHLSEGVLRGLSGCRRVVIESNHDVEMLKSGPYPYPLKQRILGDMGHLSNELCAKLLPHLAAFGTEAFMLAHLSEENNRPAIAYEASMAALLSGGYRVNDDNAGSLRLRVAPKSGVLELI